MHRIGKKQTYDNQTASKDTNATFNRDGTGMLVGCLRWLIGRHRREVNQKNGYMQ